MSDGSFQLEWVSGSPTRLRIGSTSSETERVDYEFVEGLPEELTCSICMKVLCEPHLVNCCEQQFCKTCLDKWCKKNRSCPHCRSTDFSTILLKQKSRKIGELKVYCPNKRHGCKAELKLTECDDHLSNTNDQGCQFVELDCSNECNAKVFRGELKTHLQEECPRRSVNCDLCDLKGEHQVIVGDHVDTCPSFPLPCPRGCDAQLLRKDLDAHRSTCPLEPVLCPFRGLGCKTKVLRQDLAKHIETSTLQHMTVLAESHTALQESYTALQESNTALQESNTALQTKVQAISSVLKNATPNVQSDHLVTQIYTILSESSTLPLRGSVTLGLSESNTKSGHHYIILSQRPPNPRYKLKLQWKTTPSVLSAQYGYFNYIMLFSIIDDVYPAIAADMKFDVTVDEKTLKVCCEKPRDKDSCATPLGTLTMNKRCYDTLQVSIQPHQPKGCHCECHEHYCIHCGSSCVLHATNHLCNGCRQLCQGIQKKKRKQ